MSEQREAISQGELRNDNRQAGVACDGDANANDIQTEGGGRTGDIGTLSTLMSQTSEQDKIIIWGTDSQCDDPELAEFEMLECQELEAYLVEEGEDFVGLGEQKELCDRPLSCANATVQPKTDKRNNKEERKSIQRGASEQEASASHVSESRGTAERVARTEFSSETDVFVSCLSTGSSLGGSLANVLDTADKAQMTDSWHVPSGSYRTISEDLTLASQSFHSISDKTEASQRGQGHSLSSGISSVQGRDIDLNQNSTVLSEDVISEAQMNVGIFTCKEHNGDVIEEHMQNLNQRYKLERMISSEGEGDNDGVGSSGKANERKAAKQLHEESNKKIDKSTQAEDTPDMNHNSPKTGTKGTQLSIASKAMKKQGSFDKTLNEQNSFDKTLKKQPSFDNTLKKQSSFDNTFKKQPSFDNTLRKQGSFDNTFKKQSSFDNTLRKQGSFENTLRKQGSFDNTLKKQSSFDNTLKKQGSFENSRSSSPSSLDRRKPWGSPSRSATPASPKTNWSPKKRPPDSPARVQGPRAPSLERSDSPQRVPSSLKQPSKASVSSGIPKPVLPQQREPEARRSSPPQKPKNVRPKIITYVRKSPQVKPSTTDSAYEASTLPLRLSSYPSPPAHKEPKVGPQIKATQVLCSSNMLFDKYRQEMQKAGCCHPPGTAATGVKAPSQTVPHKLSGTSESFHGELPDKYLQELPLQEAGNLYRSPRVLRPQLGLGAVTRQPANKTRLSQTSQRAAMALSQPAQAAGGPTQDPTERRRSGPETSPKMLKPGPSGLRPPGFSALPPARLAALGFVRSASVSSVSSNQSTDSTHSDPCRPSQHPSSSDDTPLHKATAPPSEASRAHSRSSPQPPNAPTLERRTLLPSTRSSPVASRKEIQKAVETVEPPVSSPKRFAVVSPKPQSPVLGRAAVGRSAPLADGAQESAERALVQKLREHSEEQARQLQSLQAQLKKASLGLEVFAVTTQHFCQKSESAILKERGLSLELAKIRDEVAFSVARWEHLRQDKEELEQRFERELQGLQAQQQSELGALEERLRDQHTAETQRLQVQQRAELEELHIQQQEQIEEMSESHEASLLEMETAHNDTLATLQEEHARTVKNLKMAHEQQRKTLEEDFEKLRLSLQDQVDTLTFQNRSLRDRAKRFEEALRRSTDEQIVDALAPYQHIEEDLKSLKEVLEMKNQQIHQQEVKITELEKMAEKNVYLEERVQILQQQNEDLMARIDKNLAVSRQLSEENANLQVHVEKESNEKKRLSRTNEELLWRLQTGELSPRMSPTSSPVHRASPGPGSPARPHSCHQ